MGYIESLNRAIEFIEQNLKSQIQVEDIANAAYYSKYHFQRLFSLMIGETVGSYLRKRRLTEAGRELVHTERNIIDIALDYQFQSQESFGRSFKNNFGLTPHQYRKGIVPNVAPQFNPLESQAVSYLSLNIRKEPELETRTQIPLIGFSYFGHSQLEIKELWNRLDGHESKVKEIIDPCKRYGLIYYEESFFKSRDFGYLASFELRTESIRDLGQLPFELTMRVLPAAKYAVFIHRGDIGAIPYTYEYIYGTWFPKSEYDLAAPYDFEFYDKPFDPLAQDRFETKIHIPISLL
jgi:AraC family transcriptional regulator